MIAQHPPAPPITLDNMHEQGARGFRLPAANELCRSDLGHKGEGRRMSSCSLGDHSPHGGMECIASRSAPSLRALSRCLPCKPQPPKKDILGLAMRSFIVAFTINC